MALVCLLGVFPASLGAEVAQKQGVRVAVQGDLLPQTLPRVGTAPVAISFSARITTAGEAGERQLEAIQIALNSNGRLRAQGLPKCRFGHISPSTTTEALDACGSALVGEGRFSAEVRIPEQSPFPSEGKVLVFNGRYKGRTALFAHIYGTKPVPTSFVLPFVLRQAGGTFGTVLDASLPRVTGNWGYVKGLSMTLKRTFVSHGRRTSYLAAGCPAPKGLSKAVFPLARTMFGFSGGLSMSAVLVRSCRVG